MHALNASRYLGSTGPSLDPSSDGPPAPKRAVGGVDEIDGRESRRGVTRGGGVPVTGPVHGPTPEIREG
ncbi:MAG TPA: hypothetical protein VGV13_00860, partial [Methylomirabilota bacterium]|nr:hypothetical protein [Methylomirabilota bacterium]